MTQLHCPFFRSKPKGSKQDTAELLAKQFPDELSSRLPPKRKLWKSEDSRMDIFDAVGLAVAFRMKKQSEQPKSRQPKKQGNAIVHK
jgi:hypothetical protein